MPRLPSKRSGAVRELAVSGVAGGLAGVGAVLARIAVEGQGGVAAFQLAIVAAAEWVPFGVCVAAIKRLEAKGSLPENDQEQGLDHSPHVAGTVARSLLKLSVAWAVASLTYVGVRWPIGLFSGGVERSWFLIREYTSVLLSSNFWWVPHWQQSFLYLSLAFLLPRGVSGLGRAAWLFIPGLCMVFLSALWFGQSPVERPWPHAGPSAIVCSLLVSIFLDWTEGEGVPSKGASVRNSSRPSKANRPIDLAYGSKRLAQLRSRLLVERSPGHPWRIGTFGCWRLPRSGPPQIPRGTSKQQRTPCCRGRRRHPRLSRRGREDRASAPGASDHPAWPR